MTDWEQVGRIVLDTGLVLDISVCGGLIGWEMYRTWKAKRIAMARFYGRMSSDNKKTTVTKTGGDHVQAVLQSYSGDIRVMVFGNKDQDWISIHVGPHSDTGYTASGIDWCIYNGPVRALCTKDGQQELIRGLALYALERDATKAA